MAPGSPGVFLEGIAYLTGYLLPTLAGNVTGGAGLAAAMNHAQVVSGKAGRADDES